MEKFEIRFGSWFAVLSIVIPVPFLSFFTVIQLLSFIVFGTVFKISDPSSIITQSNPVLGILAIILFLLGVFYLIKNRKYNKGWVWIRLLLYVQAIIFHFAMYALYLRGPMQY